jgi:hypothetical protein
MWTTIRQILSNDVLWVSVISSSLAQFIKPFTYWMRTREWDWHQMAGTGGMPSSHSALISAAALGIGIETGFDSGLFALAVAVAMIVTYDAAGVRQEAGKHARALNMLVAEVLSGHPLEQKQLQEVLGHSRAEVAAGVAFGFFTMAVWKFVLQPLFLS